MHNFDSAILGRDVVAIMAFPLQAKWLSTWLWYWHLCEGWTCIGIISKQLDQFHMRCLRKITHIKWQESHTKYHRTHDLQYQWNRGIAADCTTSLVWACHPYAGLTHSQAGFLWTTPPWLPASWWTVQTLQGPSEGYAEPMWHHTISSGNAGEWQSRLAIHVQVSSSSHGVSANWSDLQRSGPPTTSNVQCQICHRMCRSNIGLTAHVKSHARWWDPSHRWLSPLVGHWTCNSQVACSSRAPLHTGLGQATYTYVPLLPSSVIWYRPRERLHSVAGKVTVGLASHRPCVTDLKDISI